MKPQDVVCIRGGQPTQMDPREIVPGDVVNLTTGMALPADLKVNNSSLTGESDALKRDWKPNDEFVEPRESTNLVFFGTLIVEGTGRGMVINTGDNTFMGQTAQLAVGTKAESIATPLHMEIGAFVFKVCCCGMKCHF